jgi:hypothetical protein
MVDAIIRLTTVLITLIALVNVAHGVLVLARLARRVRQRHPERWVAMCLPAWQSSREASSWLASWRTLLRSPDPLVAALRIDGRTVLVRHAQLFAWSETWAMLVILIAPYAS